MAAYFSSLKSGFAAAFFLLLPSAFSWASDLSPWSTSNQHIAEQLKVEAESRRLYQSPVWAALLHADATTPYVTNPDFLLSLPSFNLARELQLTIDFLYVGAPNNVCRFPARYLWLRQNLNTPALPVESCPEVIEFLAKAPVEKISLVFASENLAQPASMLGHVFLKLTGKNEGGIEISHAISFYTDANTLNLPKLFWDSMVVGMQGFFSLSPYQTKLRQYVDEEQRTIWEYPLTLDEAQVSLIKLHLLELKQTRLTYFFQKYNCATVVNFILAVSGKNAGSDGEWMTPRDVIKRAHRVGLIETSQVISPSRWLVRALYNQVSPQEKQAIRDHILRGDIANHIDESASDAAFIRFELARAYNQYVYFTGIHAKTTWINNDSALTAVKARLFPGKNLNVDERYNPLYTPDNGQFSIALRQEEGETSFVMNVSPVSHTLTDDNRGYFNETSLRLLSADIKWTIPNNGIKLDRLTIYNIESLTPYNTWTGGISGRFSIAKEPQRDSSLVARGTFAVSGGLGLTVRAAEDMDIYAMGGGGVAHTGKVGYFYSSLETGVVLRGIWNMKTLASLTRFDNQIDRGAYYHVARITQAKYLDRSHTLMATWERYWNQNAIVHSLTLGIKMLF